MEKLNLVGEVFDYLTVVAPLPNRKGLSMWLCRCKCNTEIEVYTRILRNRSRTSCGCKKLVNGITHGMSQTSTYHIWAEMKARCGNPNTRGYYLYGARGITYDPRWESFENFLADMGERPKDLSLERVDNNGNYCLSNCKWATCLEQARNNRSNLSISYEDRTMSLAEAVELSNKLNSKALRYSIVYHRVQVRGWSVESVLGKGFN